MAIEHNLLFFLPNTWTLLISSVEVTTADFFRFPNRDSLDWKKLRVGTVVVVDDDDVVVVVVVQNPR